MKICSLRQIMECATSFSKRWYTGLPTSKFNGRISSIIAQVAKNSVKERR
jgi:hypothetical protein